MSMPASAAWPDLEPEPSLARDAGAGLTAAGQKTLPSKYLYDEVGSRLFEAICALPEYGLTAADEQLIRDHAAPMLAPFAPGLHIAELGSGSARKSRWLLRALVNRQARTSYYPIEISPEALEVSRTRLAEVPRLDVHPLCMDFLPGLAAIPRSGPLLVLFLGSTLGNFDPPAAAAFLRAVRAWLRPGDGLLLGLDLVKPTAQLLAAYDDPAGVTAAFNLNLLARLNRELGANFDLQQWQHRVRYRARERRVEMHLRSRRAQSATWPGGPHLSFRRGETIWTESSHKWRCVDIVPLVASAGFRLAQQWSTPGSTPGTTPAHIEPPRRTAVASANQGWAFAECLCLVD